jgi:prefoldin subunit 5
MISHLTIVFVQRGSDPIEATFELNDTLYAKALVPPTEEVYLWLGANVMLSYPIAEAETLLGSRLAAAQESLANCEEDLDFLREQITVSLHYDEQAVWL